MVIANDFVCPAQPFKMGVTVMLAVMGAAVLLVAAVKLTLPLPEAAKPTAVLSFVQLNVVPAKLPTKAVVMT